MNLYRDVGLAAQAGLAALRGVRRGEIWPPFLVLFGVQLAVLLYLLSLHLPTLSPIAEPVVRGLGGEPATHYPEHLWALPDMFRTANALVAILVASIAFAVATLRFASASGNWTNVRERAPALIALSILASGSAWGITSLFNLIPVEITLRSFVIRMGLQGIELGVIVIIQAMLAYGTAYLVIGGRTLGSAIGDSFRLALMFPLPTLILVAVPFAILFPPTFFIGEMDVSETGLFPESVALIMFGQLALRLVLNMLLIGSLTDLYLRFRGVNS